MQHFVLSTSAGLESLAKKEVIKQGGTITEVVDRLISFDGDFVTAAKINLWSRVGNRVYIELARFPSIDNFDDLYSSVAELNFSQYIPKDSPIIVKATSIRSVLHHTPSIQKITKKSIVDSLGGGFIYEDNSCPECVIQVLCINNQLRILLDLTGQPLHRRGYRTETGEAPIKENLAAALVLLSGWRFDTPLYDPFCGSGTILIEAAMIAKNIAPGLKREFAVTDLGFVSKTQMQKIKQEARESQFEGEYRIIGSDIDTEMLRAAEANAYQAGVLDNIFFEQKDIRSFAQNPEKHLIRSSTGKSYIVSNPPYGERLDPSNITSLYKNLSAIFDSDENILGGFISSYPDLENIFSQEKYKNRKLYNGGTRCYFWKKK